VAGRDRTGFFNDFIGFLGIQTARVTKYQRKLATERIKLLTLNLNNMSTFRDLLIWQKSMSFVTKIYKQTNKFPDEEKFGLVSQLRRSAISVPSNMAEGYGRNSNKDFIRFLNIAMGSLFEIQTQIQIAYNLKFIEQQNFDELFEQSREIERMMSSFIKSLDK
jgi:four helix bundle protein